MQRRINKLRRALKKLTPPARAILVKSPANIYYFTRIKAIEGYLLISQKETLLFTDFRYYQEAKEKLSAWCKIKMLRRNWLETITKSATKLKLNTIALEGRNISLWEYQKLKATADKNNIKLIIAGDIIEKLRAIKEAEEIRWIKKSAAIAQEALKYIGQSLYPGLSEKYVRLEVERFLKFKGDEELAFDPIVAFGKNSSFPHHISQECKLKEKEIALVDLGAKYGNYCSDLTRIFVLSKMPLYIRRLFDIMKKAKDLAIKKAKAGVKIAEVDKAARSYIEKKGYGKNFLHSLGHGVGLEVHEYPIVNARSQDILEENMVITIEPGIYIKNKFGVREENMILIKPHKAEVIA